MKIKYRFKTKEEFIKQYGKDWFAYVAGGWDNSSDGMNPFFGKPFKGEVISEYSHKNKHKIVAPSYKSEHNPYHYSISMDMLMPIDEAEAAKYLKELDEIEKQRKIDDAFKTQFTIGRAVDGYKSITYKNNVGDYHLNFEATFYYSPTANCQMLSVANFQGFLNAFPEAELCKRALRLALEHAGYNKYLAFVDVHQNYYDTLKELAYGEPTKYLSTNGSLMCYCLIKVREQ